MLCVSGRKHEGGSPGVYDQRGGRRGRYRAGRRETLDLSFCALRVLGPQGRALEFEGAEERYYL